MRTYPGVPWDAWADLPHDLVADCITHMTGG